MKSKTKKLMKAYPEFKRKVWLACASIPRGETRSYEWVAGKIGKPRACRAVANALAVNPFAPEIPCHRVIRKDGSIGGFSGRGGIMHKKRLILREKSAMNRKKR